MIILGTTDVSNIFLQKGRENKSLQSTKYLFFIGVPDSAIIGTNSSSARGQGGEPDRKKLKYQVLTKEQEEFLDEWASQPQDESEIELYNRRREQLFESPLSSDSKDISETEPTSELESESESESKKKEGGEPIQGEEREEQISPETGEREG